MKAAGSKINLRERLHFPLCLICKKPMDWLQFWEKGKRMEERPICPRCREIELVRITPDGKVTVLKPSKDGAFSLG